MGKSGKKSKSEKINALRKQYDAFLEEDKKRKDRNEYILGRMETMRSCTALVQVRSKSYPKTKESDYSSQPKYKSTMAHISNSAIALSGRTHVTPKYLNQNYDEPSVLKEISKKYFLIPKVMSNDLNKVEYKENDRDPSPNDDTDWKSKYNILEELKREEKGDHFNSTIYEKQNNLTDPYEDNKKAEYIPQESNEKSTVQNNGTNLELTPNKLQTDMSSNKELPFNNLEVKTNRNKEKQVDKTLIGENIGDLNTKKQELAPQSNKLHEVNLPTLSSMPKVSQVEINKKQDTTFSTNNNINEIKESNELSEDNLASKIEPIETLENNKYVPEEKCIEYNESQDGTGHYILNKTNHYLSPIINNENTLEIQNENTMEKHNENNTEIHNGNNMEVNHQVNALPAKNIQDNQELVHSENTVRAQGVYQEVADHLQNDPAIDIIGHQEYQLQETDSNQIPNIEQNVTSQVNDELETEQKEMFYNEDNDRNNEYNENDDTTAYPAENENYANQEYSYYDESHKEQTYPTEINEHEEATERYDPNYEQQYVNNYDDTMNTQYQPEQYNVENSYDQHQNMYVQQGDVNYQPENPNYEYAPMETVKDGEPNQNIYYTNSPQENAQYEGQQVENSEIDQQNIAYNSSEDYDAQQEYIKMQAEPLQIENVEEQLDIEDGYTANTNIVAENQDYQEVIEETTPEIPQTDVKVT